MHKMTPKLLENIGQPAFLLEPDADGNPVYVGVNDLWLGATKLPVDHAIGATAEHVFPGCFGKVAFQNHLTCLRDGVPQSYTVTMPMGGTLRTAQTNLRAVRDGSGQIIQVVGTSQDVTGQAMADEAQTNNQTLTREIESFVSMAAHDLRTSMRHVALLADMLREGFEDHGDGKLDLINSLEWVALKATELITDILSHAQASAPARTAEAFSLDLLCNDIFIMLDPMNNHHFDCDGPG